MTSASPAAPQDSTQSPGGPGLARRLGLVLPLAAVVIAADQGAKQWALTRLAGNRSISLAGGWMHLHLLVNAGAAFSFASGSTWVFTVCASVAVLAIPWYAATTRAWSRGLGLTLGMLLGGAAGNLADRLFRAPGPGTGRVVDFIDYHGWFTGNVADIAITVSAALLIARATFTSRREHRDRRDGHGTGTGRQPGAGSAPAA